MWMDSRTAFLIFIAAIVSIAVVLFQYFFKNKEKSKLNILLSVLRFVTLFVALLLLINPKLVKDDFYLEKSKLLVLVDNSSSIAEYVGVDRTKNYVRQLLGNTDLIERFDILPFAFGNALHGMDSMTFTEENTNIERALRQAIELNRTENTVITLLSDGNQTYGNDYQYTALGSQVEVLPIVLGDTTTYEDFVVSRVNLNKYAFLGNRFPVEATISYQGDSDRSTDIQIILNGTRVHRETIDFSKTSKSKTITTLIAANSVGVKSVLVEVGSFENEKNTVNNQKERVIEVIDEKTNIILVSSMLHPDIGALKKAVEANEQRSLKLVKPNSTTRVFDEADIVILYQPTPNFGPMVKNLATRAIPTFTITGTKTDFRFLNEINSDRFSVVDGYPEQEVFGKINNGFTPFDISQLNIDGYPPLLSNAGPVTLNGKADFLMNQQIKGVDMASPLVALWNENQTKHLALFGENIWQWRAQSFRDGGSFVNFDAFMGKLMVYLSQSGKRDRLELDYEKVYDGAFGARLRASYFDETFIFEANANLLLRLKSEKGATQEIPMIVRGNYFEATLDNLPSGLYDFTVKETNSNIMKSGSFKILEFEAEKQFLSSDYERLTRLAENHDGETYLPSEIDSLLDKLNTKNNYVPVQKNRQKVVSFIDFRVLLGVMAISLALEWLIRKYNGLL